MDIKAESLAKHYEWKGKIRVESNVEVKDGADLALAYTPGVAQPCLEIQKDTSKSFELTRRWNTIAVITDGSAVLGLGNIGPEAGMPVMEGKCLLFKQFADVDAIPICVDTNDTEEIIRTVKLISKSFGGINLEDIASPRCFEIERRLIAECDIPIFHDDQHGTAIVILAALINALKLTGKSAENIKVIINGPGAAGIATAKLLSVFGVKNIILCNRAGALHAESPRLNSEQKLMLDVTNPNKEYGTLEEVIRGADVFIGLSSKDALSPEMVREMADKSIVFAMANPDPEILPQNAKDAGAYVVGTGRSDFPNQINNVLAFPGIFRGVLDGRGKIIDDNIKLLTAKTIASIIPDGELSPDYIIPNVFDKRVVERIRENIIGYIKNK